MNPLDRVRLLAAFQVLSLPSGALGAKHSAARAVVTELTGGKAKGPFPVGASLEHYVEKCVSSKPAKPADERPLQQYSVKWEIDVEARSPTDAARQALKIQRRHGSIANIFDVAALDGKTVRVDLEESGPDECTACGGRFTATQADKLPICKGCK